MALPQTGQWHRAFQDPYGVTVYQENDDGSVGLFGVRFADGTAQFTAAGGNTVTVLTVNGGITITSGSSVLVKATGGAGGITVTLPTAVGAAGQMACIKKVDTGVGAVTVATTGGQTIDGVSTYLLVNQWQFVNVQSDGSNWLIVSLN